MGRVASFKGDEGMVRFGKDPALATPVAPTRPTVSRLSLRSYPQATNRVVEHFDVDDAARAEITAAHEGFVAAGPLLWDRATNPGDSRVPGFAAATTFGLGTVNADPALQTQGLADLEYAVIVNEFFDIFDYIPVVRTTPPSAPLFAQLVTRITGYLDDRDTLTCFATQPEICSNFGLAPHDAEGALVLFGDVFAKAGNLERATFWYGLAKGLGDADTIPWKFQSVLDDRIVNAAARVALYTDGDPSDDPSIIGTGAEACAACHNR